MFSIINVGIIGHTGRLGKPLVDILNKHPESDIVYTESRKEGSQGNLLKADFVFLALPYGESGKYLTKIKKKRIIDLSIDNRCNDDWVYGLPELNKAKIKNAQKVANPGCYATSILLGLLPLKGKVSNVCIASTSGVSGAGLDVKDIDNFLIYKEGRQHQQIREIEDILDINDILFVPQRIDSTEKGIISTIFAKPKIKEDLNSLYKEFYKQEQFIRIKDSIETKDVIGTNYCDIKILEIENKIIIISALDNLIKGGSGQAVQNFNIMHGFDESVGLI